eukprot:TRINITY_DN6881_c0_g1_i1.p2 TRINITY_DN6881_c0_g1~~TRINITY_DN6881_c0_g1_i1.p2  ORF type:complete len:195 (-),score=46.83 TRINITY_DN6881_c0_g1_i1:780-1364(-)
MLKQAEADDLETEEEAEEDDSGNSAITKKRKLSEGTKKKKKTVKQLEKGSARLQEDVGTKITKKKLKRGAKSGSEIIPEGVGTKQNKKSKKLLEETLKSKQESARLVIECQRLLGVPEVPASDQGERSKKSQKVAPAPDQAERDKKPQKGAATQSNKKDAPCMFIKAGKVCPHAKCRYSHEKTNCEETGETRRQ